MTSVQPYQVLARKYRPTSFDQVVGQTSVVSTLKNAILRGRLHHAYLLSGTRGVGKTTLARLFARALNCAKGPTVTPCSVCEACLEIAAGTSMDVIEIDGASNRKVEDVDPLREAARYAPARDRHKIFIIDEVHMLSETAFNALLKTLEEPPPRIVFLFATTEPDEVPDTILSRCLHLACRRVGRQEIADALARTAKAEGIAGAPEAFDLLAGLAAGSVRDGLSLLDQSIAFDSGEITPASVRAALGLIDQRLVADLIEAIGRKDAAESLAVIERLSEAGADLAHFSKDVLARIRNMMVVKASGAEAARRAGASEDETAQCETAASQFTYDGLLRLMNAALDLADRMRREENPRYLLEATALKMIRLSDLTPIEDLIRTVTGGGSTPSQGRPAAGGGAHPGLRITSVTPVSRAPESASQPPPSAGPGEPGTSGRQPTGPGRDGTVERILAVLGERKVSLATFLQQARGLRLQDDTLVVTIQDKQAFLRTALDTSENLELIRQAVSTVLGKPAQARLETEAPPVGDLTEIAGQETGADPARRRERLIGEAMKEPLVRTVMDMFKGQIVDIREGS